MVDIDTDYIHSAAGGIRDEVLPKLSGVRGIMGETEVSFPGFGLALSFLNSGYQDFRTYMVDSVSAAHEKLDTAQRQLDEAAKHWQAVEDAIARGMTP